MQNTWVPRIWNPWISPLFNAQITITPLEDSSIASISDSKQYVLHSISSSFSNKNKLLLTLTIIRWLRTMDCTWTRSVSCNEQIQYLHNKAKKKRFCITGDSGVNLKTWFFWNTLVIVSSSDVDGTKFQLIFCFYFRISVVIISTVLLNLKTPVACVYDDI